MSPADEAALHAGHYPEPMLRIATADALRALSDPTRLRLLEVMVQRQDPAWSVKELAAALGVPQTRLYHHVEQLLAHDLVRAVERRVVSGIIETRYRVTALNVQIDRRLFSAGGDADAASAILHDTLVTVFDTAREEIEAALRAGMVDTTAGAADGEVVDDGDEDDGDVERLGILVARSLSRLSPARAKELRARLNALVAEFGDEEADDARPWGVVVAVYPMQSTTEQSDG
jgi:DNA-binding transcriptional ArsR family regulator